MIRAFNHSSFIVTRRRLVEGERTEWNEILVMRTKDEKDFPNP